MGIDPQPGWISGGDKPKEPRFNDPKRGKRLQTIMADAGVASRRACETLIEEGAVEVNGITVRTLPVFVDPAKDRILVNGEPIRREALVYVMLWKPKGVVSTNADPAGRPRAIDLVGHPTGVRLFPVGRLDADSTGMLLLTNDGELAHRLAHPRFEVHKTYEVVLDGDLDDRALRKLEQGLHLADRDQPGRRTEPIRLQLISRDRRTTKVLMELHEGRNRQIRRMLLLVGHKVRKLHRVQVGPVKMTGLKSGSWRDLTPEELEALHHASSKRPGERKGRQARVGKVRPLDARDSSTTKASAKRKNTGLDRPVDPDRLTPAQKKAEEARARFAKTGRVPKPRRDADGPR